MIDSTSYSSPLKSVWYNDLIQFQTNTERVQLASLQKIEYFSDDGILLPNIKQLNEYQIKKEYDEFFYVPGTSRFLNIRLTNNKYYIRYNREYLKIQEVAANVGGIVKFFSFFLLTLSEAFSEFKLTKYLLQQNIKDIEIRKTIRMETIMNNKQTINNNLIQLKNIININENESINQNKSRNVLLIDNNKEKKIEQNRKLEDNEKDGLDKLIPFNRPKLHEELDLKVVNNLILNYDINKKLACLSEKMNYLEVIQEQNGKNLFLNDSEYDLLTFITNYIPFASTENLKKVNSFRNFLSSSFSVENFLKLKIQHNFLLAAAFDYDQESIKKFNSKTKFLYEYLYEIIEADSPKEEEN